MNIWPGVGVMAILLFTPLHFVSAKDAPSASELKDMARELTPAETQDERLEYQQSSAERKDERIEVQRWLNELGYDAGPADGVVDSRTKAAACAFHRDRNFPGDCEDHFSGGSVLTPFFERLLTARHLMGYGVGAGFFTGNEFRNLNKDSQTIYVMGVVDGMLMGSAGPPVSRGMPARPSVLSKKVKRFLNCIEDMPGNRITATVNKYLSENLDRGYQDMNELIWEAMKRTCSE